MNRTPLALFAGSAVALVALTLPRLRADSQRRRQALTLERMEMLATALERRHLHDLRYPEGRDAELLKQIAIPDFTKPADAAGRRSSMSLELKDGWGRPMEFSAQADGYLIVSHGRDGVEDADTPSLLDAARAGYPAVQPPARVLTRCSEDDIIFTMGLPLKYPDPEHDPKRCR